MVALPDFSAWQFETGLDRIRSGFRASVGAMETEQVRAIEAYDRYTASGEDDRRWNEDGALVHSTEIALEFGSLEAGLATQMVRQAFVTSAFHYWERSARAWIGSNPPNFPKLRVAIEAQGIALDPRLPTLNRLNNVLKHDSANHAEELFRERPDLFLFQRSPAGGSRQSSIVLTTANVEEFIDVVANSGPPRR